LSSSWQGTTAGQTSECSENSVITGLNQNNTQGTVSQIACAPMDGATTSNCSWKSYSQGQTVECSENQVMTGIGLRTDGYPANIKCCDVSGGGCKICKLDTSLLDSCILGE